MIGSGNIVSLPSGTALGRYPISGNNYYSVEGDPNSIRQFRINFDSAISAFGFYATDLGDFEGQLALTLIRANDSVRLTIPHSTFLNDPEAGGGFVAYFGVIDVDNPFFSVVFSNNDAGVINDVFGFDDFTVASPQQVQAVPEPATMLLLGTGLAGIAAAVRKRRHP